jgi:hypothetical protein
VTVNGHPDVPLLNERGEQISTLTVCAQCGELRTILILTGDRWYCSKCRAEGRTPPRMYPVA